MVSFAALPVSDARAAVPSGHVPKDSVRSASRAFGGPVSPGDKVPNVVLHGWLGRLGWSPEQLAAHLNAFGAARRVGLTVSSKAPYHWLRGARPRKPTPSVVAALLSHVSGEHVSAEDLGWARGKGTPSLMRADEDLADLWRPGQTLAGLQRVVRSEMSPDRRTVLMVSGMAMTAAAHQWMVDIDRLEFVAQGRRIDEAIVDDLDRIVAAKRRVDDALGGGVLYHSVRAELSFVVDLLKDSSYSESIEQRLYGAAAELSRLAGWACFDSGDEARAQRYFLVALRAARQSGDKALGAHVLGFMGLQATMTGDSRAAVTLLNSGHEGAAAQMTATEQAALFGRLARAHGKGGDARFVDVCAGKAFEYMARSKPENDPDRIYWCDEADLSGMIGEGYVALGRPDKAIPYLRRAVDGLAASFPRDQVVCIANLASAYLAAGDLGRALFEARRGAAIAAELNSDRVVGYIGNFRKDLGRQAKGVPTADLDEYLTSLFPTRLHPVLNVA
jgi:tetratricopeptide (TPR) repeat protein